MPSFVRYVYFGFCIALVGLYPSAAVAQKEKFTPYHIAKIRYVSDAKISPDGKNVAYALVVPRNIPKEKDGPAWVELHVSDSEGNTRPFITGQVNVSSVGWTPDGKFVTFLAKRDGDGQRSLYRIALAGGEASKILEHSTGIGSYSFSPEGDCVAFLGTAPKSKKDKELESQGFNQEIYEENDLPVRIWVAKLGDDAGEPRMLSAAGSASELHWAPNGNLLAVALAPTSLVDEHLMFRKVRIVDAGSGKVVRKLDNPGKIGGMAWSPDGKHLALVSGVDKNDPLAGRLWVTDVKAGKWTDLTPDLQGHVEAVGWTGPNYPIALIHKGTGSYVAAFNTKRTDGAETEILHKGPIFRNMSVAANGKAMALIGDTPHHPQELYYVGFGKRTNLRRLTYSNPWLKNMRFAKQEVIRHKARDGLMLEGILIRPLDEEKGKRYPLIMTVHGGPEAHMSNGWLNRYVYPGQVGAAEGFAVFYPNYRGSTGRGVKFSMMGQADAAGKEFDDLIDAVDHLVEIGLVDKKKVGVTGGSYGGYATAWCATKFSDRFAAGVMFVGISDAISKVGTTDIPWEMYLVHHRKWLWDDWDYFVKASPIYYMDKAKTPVLILHGKNDPRVHPSQSLEMHRLLKIRKVPTRLVLYPGEGHGNRRTASQLDYNLRMVRWMKHYLQGPGGNPPPNRLKYEWLK